MGFDIECIPNIQSLAGEYFCPVCRLLIDPNEALQSMCTHLYCKPCLAYVVSTTRACPYDGYLVTETDAKPLVESNKVLADTIGIIVVHCLYHKSGCTWLGSLSESSSHCSGCAFGSSLVVCNWCGIQIAHRQGQEHAQVCNGVQQVQVQEFQGSQHVGTSDQVQASIQASAQGQVIAAAMLTNEQWYQQQYHQYYQNYFGYYMYQQHASISNPQQQLHPPGQAPQIASQHQASYVQPAVHYVVQAQAQPQLQSQSLVLHQPHAVFPSAPHIGNTSLPQAYPSVPPHSLGPSHTFPVFQGLQNLQAQAHSQSTPLSQALYLQNTQMPQYQQFHGQTNSQLPIQNPLRPEANTVQNSLPQNTTDQGQSHKPHAYWTGHKIYPQPNQANQVGVPPNNVALYHQVETQPPQVQNHFPQQQLSVPNRSTSIETAKQLVLQYGGVSAMHPAQQPWSKPSLPLQHTFAPTTDVFRNQMHQGCPFTNPQIASQSHLRPKGLVHELQKNPQTVQVHQPITSNHGLQPQMNHQSATALQRGSVQTEPSLPAMKQADMQRTKNQVPPASWDQKIPLNPIVGKQGDETIPNGREAGSASDLTNTVNGVKHAVEVTATKFFLEPKGKHTDACGESDKRSSAVVECNETKNGPLSKQVMEENDGTCLAKPGTSSIVEKTGTEVDPCTPLEVADKSGKLVGTLDKNKDLCQTQVSRGIMSGKNQPLVKHEVLRYHQRFGAPSEEEQLGAQRYAHAPRYPPPVLRPHGLEISSRTPLGPVADLPAEIELRTDAFSHHESEGPYDHLHPSQVSDVFLSAPQPFALGMRDERFRHFSNERPNPASLEPAGLRHVDGGLKHFHRASHVDSDVFRRPGAYSSGSLDRGIDQRLPLRPHEKDGPDFDLRPTSRFSQPFNDLGERQFRRGPESPINEYPGMLSHGSGPIDHKIRSDRVGTNDIEDRYRFGFPRREFEGHGNLQMGERLRDSDMIDRDDVPNHIRGGDYSGQHGLPSLSRLKEGVDFGSSARRPGDPGFRSRYFLQGFPSDGGSFPGDVGPSRKRAVGAWCHICEVDCETLEGLDLHSQTKEHQQKSVDMVLMINQNAKKLKTAPEDSSLVSNPNNLKKADLEVYERKKNSIP